MIGIIFNHNVFDDCYKQTSVEKGLNKLETICKKLNEHLFTSWSNTNRSSCIGTDYTDDYIIVHYTSELSNTDKSEIANCIKEILTLKKAEYKVDNLPEIIIIFSKISQGDCFSFNVK